MYFVIVTILAWLWFYWSADKSRLRELFGVVAWSSFLGLMTDLVMVHYQLWSYDGLPHSLYTIPLLLDFGIYPVVTYLFTQSVPERWPKIFLRAWIWSTGAVIFEYATLEFGVMKHLLWWNLWLSYGSDILIFLSITVIYRYYRPAYVTNEQEKASQG